MKKIYSVFFVFLLSAISLISYSQINQGGSPLSFQNPQLIKNALIVEKMPAIDLQRRMAEDSINDQYKDIPWRFGENLYVNYNLNNSGTWDTLPEGDKLWRLGIRCQGAYTINLTFDNYHLPPGATLFVYNADKSQVIGAFTDFNNQADRVFATTLVTGEEITIEYYEPSNPVFPGELNLNRVTHGYRDALKYAKSFGSSGSCNNNVFCPEAATWGNQVKSVCMLVSGGNGFCTGAIVNNTSQDGIPYILTANHCYSSPSSWVFWFNWQSPTCANPPTNPPYNAISGATLKAKNANSDFCLVQMNSIPPAAYGVYYAGWNRQDIAATSGAGIHHPSGDIKKISYSNTPFTSDTWSGTPANSHWKVNWSDGVTEPGSSGSPILDQYHHIVGQLHGGPSACGASQLWDFYGKFSMSWDYGTTSATRLKDWLDPTNISGDTLAGWDPNGYFPIVTTTAATSVTESTATLNGTVNPNTLATMYHFEWGTTTSYGNLTTSTSAGSGSTAIPVSEPLTGLTTDTTYHFRLVGVNSQGTTNGNDITFTPGGASVVTTAASDITSSSATSGGDVTTDGGVPVTARGVCWSTTTDPTIAGPNHTTDGSGMGVFTSLITGLVANTGYHIRAYATNVNSVTYYGDDLQFTTACGIITLLPFNEGFEAGSTRPTCWTEENSNPAWQFVTGNGGFNPPNAHTGTKNALLKDNTAASNINKLITPVFDFTYYTDLHLSFWHTQQSWNSDQDELNIYYKNSSGGSWILLQSYLTNITFWTQETMSLPETGSYYQIAFEGNAKYGYGVCIDDIQVTGTIVPPTLNVAPPNQDVTADAGTTLFTVTSNSNWTVTSDQVWCPVTPSGTGNGTITATYTENPTTVSRIVTITVTVAGLTPVTVTVTQDGATPTLSVTPDNQNVSTPAGTTDFTITTNSSWTATSGATWCTVTPSGSGNGTIIATYLENTSVDSLIAVITVTVPGLAPQTVTVTQAGVPPTLNVTPPGRNVTALAGTTDFTVTTNSSWTASSDSLWCTVTPSGSGSGQLIATYSKNTIPTPRTANIIVTVAGLTPQAVSVSQAAGPSSVQDIPGEELLIFPNPTTGNVTIIAAKGSQNSIDVTVQNLQGQIILKKLCKGEKEYHIDLSFAAQGTYHITLVTENIVLSRKLIIIK